MVRGVLYSPRVNLFRLCAESLIHCSAARFTAYWVSALRLLALGAIQFVSGTADTLVDNFPQTIDASKRLMLRQRMPWRERKILAKRVLLGCIEVLLRNTNRCDLVERGVGFNSSTGRGTRLDDSYSARPKS